MYLNNNYLLNICFQLRNLSADEEIGGGLRMPWQAVYNDGALTGLFTAVDDVEWAVNIKRALTSILQLDLTPLAAGSLAFISQEVTTLRIKKKL